MCDITCYENVIPKLCITNQHKAYISSGAAYILEGDGGGARACKGAALYTTPYLEPQVADSVQFQT